MSSPTPDARLSSAARTHVAVVIPMYQAEKTIGKVIAGIPHWIQTIIVVDDCSSDSSVHVVVALNDPRVRLIRHSENQGVGAATMSGYERACSLGAEFLVKMDADGQMDPDFLLPLLVPVLEGEADYAKGNRFLHGDQLPCMPLLRRVGNLGLSFLAKIATGYWNIFDPTNGFTALAASVFRLVDKRAISTRYFFETSMLISLASARAVVKDVHLPARYGKEQSHLSEMSSLLRFPPMLVRAFVRRFWREHFLRDFGLCSVFLLAGFALLLFGTLFGGYHWWLSYVTNIAAPTGTVMLAVLPVILGAQLLLQAIVLDVQQVPRAPLQTVQRQLRAYAKELDSSTKVGELDLLEKTR